MKTVLKIFFYFIFACLFLNGCSEQKNSPFLSTAIQFRDSLRESDVWSEVIHYTYKDSKNGKKYKHAVVVFKYPAKNKHIRIYDRDGSIGIIDFYWDKENFNQYAKDLIIKVEQYKKNYNRSIIEAEVIK